MAGMGAGVLLALAVSAPPSLPMQRYDPTALTVSQLFARVNAAVGSRLPGLYHLAMQTESRSGEMGRSDTFTNGADYRTTSHFGAYAWSYGEYEGRQWQQDANGLVLPSSNLFAQTDPSVGSRRGFEAPAADVRLLGITQGSSPSYFVQAVPGDGFSERLYYDARTFLLRRREFIDFDRHRNVWEYRDYTGLFGEEVARDIVYRRDEKLVSHTTLAVYERLPSVADLRIPVPKSLFDLEGNDAIELPATFTENGIIVPVTIRGRNLDFLLDSGSGGLWIDPDVARGLGLAVTGAQPGSFVGDYTTGYARAPGASVAGVNAANVAFNTLHIAQQVGTRLVVGLLGTDFFATGALEVDFKDQKVTLRRSVPQGLEAHGWSAISLRFDSGAPMLAAEFGKQSGFFIADLGAVLTTLSPHYFARFRDAMPAKVPENEQLVTLAGRPFAVEQLTFHRLALGDRVFGDVDVVVPSAIYAEDRDYDGLMGRDILSNFDLIFDYNDDCLWFKPFYQG